jgi:hypothetical protein
MSAVFCIVPLEFNSFYIAGTRKVHAPCSAEGHAFAADEKCINVGCRMWQDGDVEIHLGRAADFLHYTEPHVEALLETPRKKLLPFDANYPELMSIRTDNVKTRIRIWPNHATEPDHVVGKVGE